MASRIFGCDASCLPYTGLPRQLLLCSVIIEELRSLRVVHPQKSCYGDLARHDSRFLQTALRPWASENIMKLLIFTMCIALSIVARCFADEANLVANGSFESSNISAGVPDYWSASGTATVKQSLSLDVGRDGRRCAKLECTEFAGDGPAAHAMIAQTGKVSVRKGAVVSARILGEGGAHQARRGRSRLSPTRGLGITRACRRPSRRRHGGSRSSSCSRPNPTCPLPPAGCSSGSRAPARSGWMTSCLPNPRSAGSGSRRSPPTA